MARDPRVDDYIAGRAEFARPILEEIRSRVHAACPEVEEALKWSSPYFSYRGKPLAGMAAFKAHAAFGFWHRGERDPDARTGAMGDYGRITSIDDLGSESDFAAKVHEAIAQIHAGTKAVRSSKPEIAMPDDLATALAADAAAQATFDGFSPSARREYLEWVTEAKRPETRAKRIAQAVEWMAEGKKRNWKYEAC